MPQGTNISENSRRIARNTVLLYFRMFVLMLVGLFTYRVIIRSLGVTDYGVYSAVGGVVTVFMLVMNTVTTAISRYIAVGIGKGDKDHLHIIFGNSLTIMAAFCLLIVLLTETVGLWYLNNKMVIPAERIDTAEIVLHTSLIVLVLNMMCVPYTAVITAHEHMGAYAYLSILEALLKLGVALAVWLSPGDRLAVYAWALVLLALLVRSAYAGYAMKHFQEAKTGFRCNGGLIREMGSFAGWNFLGSGAYMLNTQGINQLMNHFFGVGMNAARGVADKVEQVVRQFAANVALALNPQLTKSYVAGNKDYAYELVCKGSKYYFWILFALSLPFFTDAETIITLWLGPVPQEAVLFTKLTLVCFLVDFTPNTLLILQQASGKMAKYYLLTSFVTLLAFPATWIMYRMGMPAWTGYASFVLFYLIKSAVMLAIVHADTGLPVRKYLKEAVLPMVSAAIMPLLPVIPICLLIEPVWWRFLLVIAVSVPSMAAALWLFGLTEGEKAYIRTRLPISFRKASER